MAIICDYVIITITSNHQLANHLQKHFNIYLQKPQQCTGHYSIGKTHLTIIAGIRLSTAITTLMSVVLYLEFLLNAVN